MNFDDIRVGYLLNDFHIGTSYLLYVCQKKPTEFTCVEFDSYPSSESRGRELYTDIFQEAY